MSFPSQTLRRLLRAVPLVAVLTVLLGALYLVSSVEQETTQLGRLALWVFLVTALALLVLFAVILGRLVRLIQRLRRDEPGARLTARLVAVFSALALPPVVILYLFAVQFLTETVEGWLDVQTEQALADSVELAQLFIELRTREVRGEVERLARELDVDDEDLLFRQLLRRVSAAGPVELSIINSAGRAELSVNIDPGELLADLPSSFALSQAIDNLDYAAAERAEDGLKIRVLRRLPTAPLGAGPLVLQAIYPLPEEFSDLAGQIEQAYFRYDNVAFLRSRLQQSLVLILSLVLLITALLALLLAFNAARKLTSPIRDLVSATREMTAGRFPSEVPVSTRDELGFLVRSFNTMTRELAQSQRQLEAQRRYLEIVLGRLSAGVLAFDGQGRLSAHNESAGRILGLTDGDVGKHLGELESDHPRIRPLLSAIESRLHGPGSDWRQEVQLGEPGSSLVLVCRGSSLPLETGGHVVVFDDVTVLDQAQREAAWAEVARRLAHEVKNPLTPIQLAAERLQLKLAGHLNEADAELLAKATRTIRAQVDALKRLVDAFGDYARTPAVKLQSLSLARLVNEVVDLYASGEAPIRFDVRVAAGADRVRADAGRLRQVLLNLIGNAQEAHPEGRPEIAIEMTADRIDDVAAVAMVVRDNGPGFAAEVLERVFEPYVTTKPRGTGLGLAIVRRIIEEHGGTIDLGNRDDGGAWVRIRLPAADAG